MRPSSGWGYWPCSGSWPVPCCCPPRKPKALPAPRHTATRLASPGARPHDSALSCLSTGLPAGIGVIWGFLPIYADQRFQPGAAAIGLLIMTGVLVSGLFHVPMGYIADWFDKIKMVVGGGILAGTALLGFAWAGSFTEMLLGSISFGMGGGIKRAGPDGPGRPEGGGIDAMGSVAPFFNPGPQPRHADRGPAGWLCHGLARAQLGLPGRRRHHARRHRGLPVLVRRGAASRAALRGPAASARRPIGGTDPSD